MDAALHDEAPRFAPTLHVHSPKRTPAGSREAATVLIVDDEESVRESTAAILRHRGFTILEADDGAAATWLLASEHIDVVLLDLHLGHQDGIAVLESLEESSTVVIFSGFSDIEEDRLRHQFGTVVFDCLLKPVPPPLLIAVVEAAAMQARRHGRVTAVRPIAPRMALRLAMAGLAHMTPETDDNRPDRARHLDPLP